MSRFARYALVIVAVLAALGLLENVAIATLLPELPRLPNDFSSAYVRRELRSAGPREAFFLGDSVVWGYGLAPDRTAVALLDRAGLPARNLAFKFGSPANDYVLARLIASLPQRPAVVVLQVNQKVFNPADQAYAALHPALAPLARPLLSAHDAALLNLPAPAPFAAAADRVGTAWLLYAYRSDLRDLLFGDPPDPVRKVDADALLGAYDLTPLDERNVGVHFLVETLGVLRAAGIRVVAFLTPTNHALLRETIDVPEYARNGAYLTRLLERGGARVIDLDRAFPAGAFLDNDHLTAAGHLRLAHALAPAVRGALAALPEREL